MKRELSVKTSIIVSVVILASLVNTAIDVINFLIKLL